MQVLNKIRIIFLQRYCLPRMECTRKCEMCATGIFIAIKLYTFINLYIFIKMMTMMTMDDDDDDDYNDDNVKKVI